jgi:hypothetical protein
LPIHPTPLCFVFAKRQWMFFSKDRKAGAVMDTFGSGTPVQQEQVAEYEVPVDPMEELQCDSCQ